MKRKWTAFNKVMFVISIICSLILVIAATCISAVNLRLGGNAFWVCLLGIVIALVTHSVWGMLIEISCNIINLHSQSPEVLNNVKGNSENSWICSSCGRANSNDFLYCQGCGTQKNEDIKEA